MNDPILEPTKNKLPKCLVFGGFDVLMPGHLSFLGKAKDLCEHLTVALTASLLGESFSNPFDVRKSQLLNTGFVDKVVPVKDFDECAAVIKDENIDIYAYGNSRWRIETPNCDIRHIDSGKVFLYRLNVGIGHACTLKCKHCCNLSPYAPRDAYRYNIHEVINSLDKVRAVADIRVCSIFGGEPFLHPDLHLLLTYAINSDIGKIEIDTNGTVIPNISLDLLANPKIIIKISSYPIVAEKQRKLHEYLDKNGIDNYFRDITRPWCDHGCQPNRQMNSEDETREIFSLCELKYCLTLENGVMGYCGLSIIAPRVIGFLPKAGDYLYVNESGDLMTDLYNYVYRPTYMEVCKYCNGGNENSPKVEPGREQIP